MTKYFIDERGNYLGGFDGAEPPVGAVEIPVSPEYGSDILIEGVWTQTDDRKTQVFNETRRTEYEKEGITTDAMIVALWEGDQDTINAMEAKRQAVKARIPKV